MTTELKLNQNDKRRLAMLEALGSTIREVEFRADSEKSSNPTLSSALRSVASSLEKRHAKLFAVSRKAGLV